MKDTKECLEKQIKFEKDAIEMHERRIKECKKIVEECEEQLKDNDWDKRCEFSYITSDGCVASDTEDLHKHHNYFPKRNFTKKQLIADRVPDMSPLEKFAYKFAKTHRMKWLSDEERLDNEVEGYGVGFSVALHMFKAVRIYTFTTRKWFAKSDDAQAFCDYLNNGNYDYRGIEK